MRRRVFIVLVSALLLGACGGGEETTATPDTVEGTPTETAGDGGAATAGDPVAGKTIFMGQGCGSCHVLADAGTNGTVGPNLDDAKPDLDTAIDRVTNGKPPMPAFKDKLTEKQIADVAAYVVEATSG